MKDFDKDEMIKIDFVRQKFLETAMVFGFNLMEIKENDGVTMQYLLDL